ncbi:hypothetical protein [Achromobacter sp. CSND-B12]|uniref:hypothetical protein n=1 Tax=Achromobacter sp. CSND-B12 TaxID=3462570 RepID=UPI00406A5EAE
MPSGEFEQLSRIVADPGDETPAKEVAVATADLERELQYEKEARREERFIFLLCIVALIDALAFMQMENWTGPVVIGLLQLIAITVYARRSGVDEVVQLLDRLAAAFKRDKVPGD